MCIYCLSFCFVFFINNTMYKIFTIFIAVVITSCLAQRPVRYRNKRIPYEDDDYREGDLDDERPNDVRDMRPYDHHGGRFNQLHDMTRQTHFDVGGGRDPPFRDPQLDYTGFRGYSLQHTKPNPLQYSPQALQQAYQSQQQQQAQQQQPQQPQQPQQGQQQLGSGYDGGRSGGFGYNPYGQYGYNPYGWNRPGYGYGFNRPTQTADPWRGSSFLGFPFNLLGLGSYKPWWSGNRFGFGLF